jgi:Lon protease-like protein
LSADPRPGKGEGALRVVPLFPLPNVFLFPGCVMPLHVFEPRYCEMVEDLLDGPGQLAMGTVPEQFVQDLPGAPPFAEIGGLGEICRHERQDDGRFLIWLFGLSRVRMREVESEHAYRCVTIEPLLETAPPPEQIEDLRNRLSRAILARCDEFLNLPREMPLSCLVDLLLQRLGLPQPEMERLYAELDVGKRAETALLEHAIRPIPPPKAIPPG